MSEKFIQQFGDKLVSPANDYSEVTPSDALGGKNVVMIYFSAHWCPPCRQFTPKLIEFYNAIKSKRNDVELVFVSLDKTESQWKEYTSDMPWICVPFVDGLSPQQKQVLAGTYGVQGIPHLALVDGTDGKTITTDGRDGVLLDEEGANFPWKPKTFSEIWPDDMELLTKDGDGGNAAAVTSSSSTKDKYLMLYFSAHWCPPCKAFTPVLSKAYKQMKEIRGDDFELVFVSADRDEESFDEYYAEMTFCALPYKERDVQRSLSKLFQVRGIPTLLMLGPTDGDGNRPIVNKNVRSFIEGGDYDEFPFDPKPYGDLQNNAVNINETKTLVVFHENGDDDDQKDVVNALKEAATTYNSNKDGPSSTVDFLWSFDPKGIGPAIREKTNIGPVETAGSDPVMVLLDLADRGGYYVADSKTFDVTTVEGIVQFVENPGERRQMK